jgi:hypothetical protein
MRKERRLRELENMVLKRIFGPKRKEVTRVGKNYIMKNFIICNPRPKL